MDWVDDERAGRHDKVIPREPDLGKRLKAIGALVGREDGDVWVNCPLSIVLEQVKGARDDEHTAWLITPHGEKVPIPPHVAAQIRSIEYNGGQPVGIQTEDEIRVTDAETIIAEHGWATDDVPTQAEEPIEDRLHRAFLNGYREGSERAARGYRWDHS
jgi:hypothetical protein